MVCDSADYGLKPFLKEYMRTYFYLLQYHDNIETFFYKNIETFMETQRRNLNLLLENFSYFLSKGPVISKKFIGFKNLMS